MLDNKALLKGKTGIVPGAAREVARMALQDLRKQVGHGGCVDEHLQDQLIVLMALANGTRSCPSPLSSLLPPPPSLIA